MTFAKKLSFLMSLTVSSNKQLAEAVNVDPSLISRFRNARRGAPKNQTYVKAMANYFARRCEGNYQRVALSEAMRRKHLQLQMDVAQLSAVLFDWLTDSRDQVGQFLNTFERFTVGDTEAEHPFAGLAQPPRGESGSFTYYGNEGKRGAIGAFIAHLMSLETPGTVLLSSDEDTEWLFEEPAYLARLQEQIMLLMQKGFRICRIAMPLYTADEAFDSLSRWLAVYLTGQMESFYYPRLRDDLYRRTLLVLPDVAAVEAFSTGGQTVGRATIFTRDRRLANALTDDFRDILAKCRPMMTTYSAAANPEELLRCILQFESDRGNRIQQSTSLSSITAPPELIRLAAAGAPEKEAAAIISAMAEAQAKFRQSLAGYEVIDIHRLAPVSEVRAGRLPIGVSYLQHTASVCYTPQSYALHLKSILELVETYANYRAVLLPHEDNMHALMIKEGRQAMLLRASAPLMVFEVSQPNIAEACREYLMRLIETRATPAVQRQDVIATLRRTIRELEEG